MSTATPPSFFDEKHAAHYDERFAELQGMRDALHLLTAGVLAGLPPDARILCVGAGTGAEILSLAARFPNWRFTAVEPSAPMLAVCRRKIGNAGIAGRCELHEGYLDSLPEAPPFHAAVSLLVSQFILEPDQRRGFFEGIAGRLMPGGCLVNADLSADRASEDYEALFGVWGNLMRMTGSSPEQIENLRGSYGRDVAVDSPDEVVDLIASAGFGRPVAFFQSALIRGWFAFRG